MSEELNKTEDIIMDDKKKNKKKESIIIEKYQYIPEDKEILIVDEPSVPVSTLIEKKIENVSIKSNKELYESYIQELKKFSLSINNEIIYDSSIDKSSTYPIKFETDYFILYGKKYSYNGLKVQKINIK